MSHAAKIDGSKPPHSAWMSWLAIAAVAIVMGMLVPQLMPGETVSEKAEPKSAESSPVKSGREQKKDLQYAAPTFPEAPSVPGMFLRLGVGTAVVLGLCVATLWGIRRWLYPAAANGSTSRDMHLMETLHLGNRCALHLVHLHKQPILVGVDGAGIKTIVPLPATFEDVLSEAAHAPPGADEVAAKLSLGTSNASKRAA